MNIVPAQRPAVERATAVAWALEQGCTDDFFVLGRGGYFRRSMGTDAQGRGVYDDAIVVVTPSVFLAFNGNVNPCRGEIGMASLQDGIWPMKRVTHHPNTARAYPCWGQAGEVIVRRDGTETVEKGFKHPKYGECLGGGLWKGDFAIQLHSGFLYETGSEACQTVYRPQWAECDNAILAEMTARHLETFPYVLTTRPT